MAEIILDLFGGDNELAAMLPGIAAPLERLPDLRLTLVGDRERIEPELGKYSAFSDRIAVIHAADVLTNDENPMLSVHSDRDYSLTKAFDGYLGAKEPACLISVGSTGAILVSSFVRLGLRPGVQKPALASILPRDDGRMFCLLDCGANLDVGAEELLSFARLGADYMKRSFGEERPRVALLSVGREDSKGSALTKRAFSLLSGSELDFAGNIEAYDLFTPAADVVVCDGFSGNLILKNTEATGKRIVGRMLENASAKGGELRREQESLCAGVLGMYSFNELGGAVVLGVNKYVVKAHGRAGAATIESCIFQALPLVM